MSEFVRRVEATAEEAERREERQTRQQGAQLTRSEARAVEQEIAQGCAEEQLRE